MCPLGLFTIGDNVKDFANLTYTEYYTLFQLAMFDITQGYWPNYYIEQSHADNSPCMHVILCSPSLPHISHIHNVHPSEGDVFYLRALLQHRPASSHVDAQTVDGVELPTYQEAATELGMFANENELQYSVHHVLGTPTSMGQHTL